MTKTEARNAFTQKIPVMHNGIEYAYISALIYRMKDQRMVITAEMMDKSGGSVTIADIKRITEGWRHNEQIRNT